MKRTLKDYLLITLKGIGMGAADVVPGVSGGTIAFIVGIYAELVDSIKSINLQSIKLLFTFKIKDFWKSINGNFLFSLLMGICLSIFSLAKLMTYLLDTHPVILWSFFFGLILASTWFVLRDIGQWNWKTVAFLVIGTAVAYFITSAVPIRTPNELPFVFIYGAIAICAMILPGISGSFILVLLDKYYFIMEAVKELRLGILFTFAAGALVGIICFSRILSFLLRKYHDLTVASLSGFMIGSLNKVWPWKRILSTYIDSHGVITPMIEVNVRPDGLVLEALLAAIIGFLIVYLLEKISATVIGK